MSQPRATDLAAAAVAAVEELGDRVRTAIRPVVIGQHAVIDDLLVSLLCGGHCLVEGLPGLAKTLIVKSLAAATALDFGRIQFTPDILPADILGTDILTDQPTGGRRLEFLPGPVFHHVLLADEINRAPPKTQAALLEAMQEGQVTVGGVRHLLPQPFFVLATRNPLEQEGTYPLPEGQLDRFLMQIRVDYPTREEEIAVVRLTTGPAATEVSPVVDRELLLAAQQTVRLIPVAEPLLEQAVECVRASRPGDRHAPDWLGRLVEYGAGPRAAQALVVTAKARAALAGRPCVSLDDLRRSAPAVLRHRIIPSFEADASGVSAEAIVTRLVAERLLAT
jgi:MoxR-like ATPase